ncbi:MAG TPA: SGNH/GDSL hydrolase family protein, partial [Bacilli bacterium]|nr:SGNH/GDSL hydrolase family protein [Bacilli bacterium]
MIRYTALGDSITAGESATSPARAYPGLVLRSLRRSGTQADGLVLAVPGWTSGDLEQGLELNPVTPLSEATAVTLWVGGNDLAQAGLAMANGAPRSVVEHTLTGYARHLETMCGLIRKVSPAKLLLCTQYDPFPNTPLSREGINALNTITTGVAKRHRATVVPVHSWIDGRQAELL